MAIQSDGSISLAKIALDGLSLRRDLIAENLANVDTPGYQAQDVNFENLLQMARRSGNGMGVVKTKTNHMDPDALTGSGFSVSPRQGGTFRADGNNVDIDLELMQLTETGIRYDALSSIVNSKLQLLKTIATGR
ncbi:MAG: flagellar basal body rod protein FlgB [Anaerolineaceae bacterium]|nr:flagellar basal body rod protein FlgB [Anaerolineaceae bacterium]